jgi:hypothetical protein
MFGIAFDWLSRAVSCLGLSSMWGLNLPTVPIMGCHVCRSPSAVSAVHSCQSTASWARMLKIRSSYPYTARHFPVVSRMFPRLHTLNALNRTNNGLAVGYRWTLQSSMIQYLPLYVLALPDPDELLCTLSASWRSRRRHVKRAVVVCAFHALRRAHTLP